MKNKNNIKIKELIDFNSKYYVTRNEETILDFFSEGTEDGILRHRLDGRGDYFSFDEVEVEDCLNGKPDSLNRLIFKVSDEENMEKILKHSIIPKVKKDIEREIKFHNDRIEYFNNKLNQLENVQKAL